MGAVIGGLHCAGRMEAYADWVTGLSQRDVLRLMDPSIKAPGVIRAEKVMGRVAALLDGARIEDLPIPYTAVATDLIAQREVWFQQGLLATAMRASVAIPSLIAPVVVDGRLLADGGLMNNLPIAPLTPIRAEKVIAVSLSGPRRGRVPRRGVSPVPRSVTRRFGGSSANSVTRTWCVPWPPESAWERNPMSRTVR